jgi:hypothetical protein
MIAPIPRRVNRFESVHESRRFADPPRLPIRAKWTTLRRVTSDAPRLSLRLTANSATAAVLVLAAASMLAPNAAHAQTTAPAPKPAPAAAATTPPAVGLGGFRLPLLREGTVLARVVGDLALDPDERVWLFRPLKADPSGLRREFVLLPCGTLEDMLRAARAAQPGLEFEVTGRVFNYRGRNFLLPELAPAIVRVEPAKPTSTKPTPTAAPTRDDSPRDEDDAAVADIERRLEERIGTVPLTVRDQPKAATSAARDIGTPAVPAGTRLVLRRGRLSRDPQAGSWRFVPEQTSGAGDASLELLPCSLLERLENDARQSDAPPIVLLSGNVAVFEGRSYLLPTTYRRAREGRGLSP